MIPAKQKSSSSLEEKLEIYQISILEMILLMFVTITLTLVSKKAINKQVGQARQAMFALLARASKLHLPIDVICDLFDEIVLPILLYGCEVWGLGNTDHGEIFYRKFLKRILNISKFLGKLYRVWRDRQVRA